MKALLLAAALTTAAAATGAEPQGPEGGQRFVVITYEVWGDTRLSFTHVYDTVAEAERVALKVGLCGYWRIDMESWPPRDVYVAPGAVREAFAFDPAEIPPPPIAARLREQLGDPLPLPPPPTVSRLVDCPAAGSALRLRLQPTR